MTTIHSHSARAVWTMTIAAALAAALTAASLAAQSEPRTAPYSAHSGYSAQAVPQPAGHPAPHTEDSSPVPAPKVGTILIAHGAGSEWNSQVERIAHTAKTGGPLAVAYLMGEAAKAHRFQDAVKALVDSVVSEIVVMPLLVSSHSGHYEQIRYLAGATDSLSHTMMHHLHMSGLERPKTGIPIRVARARRCTRDG